MTRRPRRPTRTALVAVAALVAAAGAAPAQAPAAAQLELVPVDGGPRTVLTRTVAADLAFAHLGWSPDGAALTFLRGAREEWDQAPAAVLRQPVAGGPPAVVRALGTIAGARLSPDGRFVAALPFRTAAGRVRPIVVRDVATGSVRARLRPLEPPDDGPVFVVGSGPALCWSPDGRRLSIVERDRRGERSVTRVLDPAAGRTILVRRSPDGSADGGCFTPDGRLMVRARPMRREAVRTLDPVTKAERAVPLGGRSVDELVVWSPDGRRVAYASGEEIAVVDAATGRGPGLPIVPTGLLQGNTASGVTAMEWSPDGRTLALLYDESDRRFPHSVRRGPRLIVLPADGSGPPRELVRASTRSTLTGMAWSPDGSRIALASSRP